MENKFDPDLFSQAIATAWHKIFVEDARSILASLTRYAALASGMVTDRQHQDLALLTVTVARRHSDRRALNIDLHPTFRSDSARSILFQLQFRRERLLLASHHRPELCWEPELRSMNDLIAVRKRILPAAELRHAQKVQLHLEQGVLLRQARDLSTAGKPFDTVAAKLTDNQIGAIIQALQDMVISIRNSFRIADQDDDQIAAANAHRRKTEADGVVHLLGQIASTDALAGARLIRRELNSLDDVYLDQSTDLRPDVKVLWLLAMADQSARYNETEQTRHYLRAAVAELPEGIPHLAIRSASLAAAIGETELTNRLVEKIPQGRIWPSYLKHLVARLRHNEP